MSVGFYAVRRVEVKERNLVIIRKTRAIGLGTVAGASYQGAEVVAVDLDGHNLELAQRLGASRSVNTKVESVERVVAEMTRREGAVVAIEVMGLPRAYRQAVDLPAFTGRVVFIGYARGGRLRHLLDHSFRYVAVVLSLEVYERLCELAVVRLAEKISEADRGFLSAVLSWRRMRQYR